MKGDPKCPCCEIDLRGGVDRACRHFVIPSVVEAGGKFWAVIDPQDGMPPRLNKNPCSTHDEAMGVAKAEADAWTQSVWAMVRAAGGPSRIMKGGAA